MLSGIYKITSPTNCVYIGQSWNVHKRKNHYKRNICKDQSRLYNSLVKYGWENHTIEILIVCEYGESCQSEMDFYEIYFWQTFIDLGYEMLNLKEPGAYGKHTQVTKDKIAKTLRNRPKFTEEHLKNMSLSQKGKSKAPHSIETKIKIGRAHAGKKLSVETRNKISLSKKGKKIMVSESQRQNLIELHKKRHKPIIQFSIDGKYVKEWESIKHAAIELNISRANIGHCLNNRTKRAGSFKWQFKNA